MFSGKDNSMILICDNCHHLFDSDTFQGTFESDKTAISTCCPFCGASTVIYTISTGNINEERAFPAIRHASSNENNMYEQAIRKAGSSGYLNKKTAESKVRIEEAINLISLVADRMSDDEHNMLLIFAFFYGYSTDARIWLKPILGLSRFRPGSRGRSADPCFDTIRVYENVTEMFRSFATRPNHYPGHLSSNASHVASLMRQSGVALGNKSSAKVYSVIIKNISIQTLSTSPGAVYLNVIKKLVELCEKSQCGLHH